MTQKVLIVDDEPDIRELLEITLGRMQLNTTSACDLQQARHMLTQEHYHLCLTDMRLPDGDGIDLVREIQQHYPDMPVAVITAHGSTETALQALKAGAFDFVSKPVDLIKLRSLVSTALKLSEDSEPAKQQTNGATTDSIIGQSREIAHLKQQIAKLARNQAPVFISGESGSGKELVARSIHALGPRRDKPFIAINCGAIPTELMESEFFGHKKGSFTGAGQDKKGLFQAAQGGSLFLDEIADLPLNMQVKLLRAFQEKTIRPVGSQTEVPVDVRIISATHKNLSREVELGNLRQDLFYRINVIELNVPPLRKRRRDIPLLAQHMLDRFSQESGTDTVRIAESALQQLLGYDFPGNVRELENILQRACALADNNQIQHFDLPVNNVHSSADNNLNGVSEPAPAVNIDPSLVESFSLERHLAEVEKNAIETALQETRWNKTEAARKLGMSFRSFRYRVKKLGLD